MGRLSTINFLIKVTCFVTRVNVIINIKMSLPKLQGGQLTFPFCKASLVLLNIRVKKY
jgi:hypothetical protein